MSGTPAMQVARRSILPLLAGLIAEAAAAGPLTLDVQGSVLMALRQNAAFRVETLTPDLVRTVEQEERAAFDPVLGASLSGSDVREGTFESSGGDAAAAGVTARETLPTGTSLQAGATRSREDNGAPVSESYDVKATQALLRGFGTDVNLARLRQARLDTQMSVYELRGAAESLVAQVERAYWDCVLAERAIAIYEQSVRIAEQAIAEARERIRVGALAETELAVVEAELASRRESLINARSALAKSRLQFLRLLTPSGEDRFSREVVLTQSPEPSSAEALDDVAAHVALGLRQRADLNQARLSVAKGRIELVRTRNGLLPKLDFFVRLGGTRYSEAFGTMDGDEWSRDAQAGVALEHALGRRAERAAHTRAALSLEQAQGAVTNLQDLVEVDIRTAYVEVRRSEEQIKATEATRKLRNEVQRTEIEKLRVGRSTAILVAQAARDLLQSEIGCLGAVISYRKALLDLYRLEGSLLERRGIEPAAGGGGAEE